MSEVKQILAEHKLPCECYKCMRRDWRKEHRILCAALSGMLQKIEKLAAVPDSEVPDSDWSIGNYDDVFSDGIKVGEIWLSRSLLKGLQDAAE